MGSVVHQHIDTAEGAGSLVDYRPAMRRIAYIAAHQGAFAPGFFDPFLRFLRVAILAQIGYQHIRAIAREGDCARATDPAVAAGDDDPFSFETAGALVAVFAVIGLGVHCLGRARNTLLLLRQGRLDPVGGSLSHDGLPRDYGM